MSSIIENRAHLQNTRRSVHFRDFSWRKNNECKLYRGFTRDDLGEKIKLCLMVPIKDAWSEEDCDREIRNMQWIQTLAEKFNSVVSAKSKVKVIVPQKAIIDRTARVHNLKFRKRSLSRDEWILAFDKIKGELQVFVDRNGTRKAVELMAAFVHFTYHETNGQCVVSKLHGSHGKDRYNLFCPKLNERDHDIMKVMRNHKCNNFCSEFDVPQDIGHSRPNIHVPTQPSLQPSAPPPEDTESDDDVFLPTGTTKYEEERVAFELQRLNSSQYFAIPLPVPNGQFQGYEHPPPYTSQCPNGHQVAIPCGQYDINGNQQSCNVNSNLLFYGDSAHIQQLSLDALGLS